MVFCTLGLLVEFVLSKSSHPSKSWVWGIRHVQRAICTMGAEGGRMMGKMYGYARVSSRDQNLARQLDALAGFEIPSERIFTDKASGKDFERPKYLQLLAILQAGDVLVIKSIDRLGRSYDEILNQWRLLTKERGVAVVVLDMPLLDTRSGSGGLTGVLISDIVLQLLSYVAQMERENIRQRQAEGIAAAKARGVRFGRPRIEKPASFKETMDLFKRGHITRLMAADRLNVSASTFNRWLREEADASWQE